MAPSLKNCRRDAYHLLAGLEGHGHGVLTLHGRAGSDFGQELFRNRRWAAVGGAFQPARLDHGGHWSGLDDQKPALPVADAACRRPMPKLPARCSLVIVACDGAPIAHSTSLPDNEPLTRWRTAAGLRRSWRSRIADQVRRVAPRYASDALSCWRAQEARIAFRQPAPHAIQKRRGGLISCTGQRLADCEAKSGLDISQVSVALGK